MSKLNPFLATKEQSTDICTICGEKTSFGGQWRGMGGDITLCKKESCHEKLLELLIDTLLDGDIYCGTNYGELQHEDKKLTNFVSKVFWRKMFLEKLLEGLIKTTGR